MSNELLELLQILESHDETLAAKILAHVLRETPPDFADEVQQ